MRFNGLRILVTMTIMIVGMTGAVAADEGKFTGKFGYYTVGETYTIEEGHLFFTGEFSGTFFNDEGQGMMHNAAVVCPAVNDLNYKTDQGAAHGYCIVTDPQGDKALAEWSCTGKASAGSCEGEFRWTGGTGKFQGISGDSTFAAQNVSLNEKGRVSGYAVWNARYRLP